MSHSDSTCPLEAQQRCEVPVPKKSDGQASAHDFESTFYSYVACEFIPIVGCRTPIDHRGQVTSHSHTSEPFDACSLEAWQNRLQCRLQPRPRFIAPSDYQSLHTYCYSRRGVVVCSVRNTQEVIGGLYCRMRKEELGLQERDTRRVEEEYNVSLRA